jgi:hypothetical protein
MVFRLVALVKSLLGKGVLLCKLTLASRALPDLAQVEFGGGVSSSTFPNAKRYFLQIHLETAGLSVILSSG